MVKDKEKTPKNSKLSPIYYENEAEEKSGKKMGADEKTAVAFRGKRTWEMRKKSPAAEAAGDLD